MKTVGVGEGSRVGVDVGSSESVVGVAKSGANVSVAGAGESVKGRGEEEDVEAGKVIVKRLPPRRKYQLPIPINNKRKMP